MNLPARETDSRMIPRAHASSAPLPGLKHQAYKRLMVSGEAKRGGEGARMLTKAEWDEIERWSQANIDPE